MRRCSLQPQVPICGWLMALPWCVTLSGCWCWLLRCSNYFLYGHICLFQLMFMMLHCNYPMFNANFHSPNYTVKIRSCTVHAYEVSFHYVTQGLQGFHIWRVHPQIVTDALYGFHDSGHGCVLSWFTPKICAGFCSMLGRSRDFFQNLVILNWNMAVNICKICIQIGLLDFLDNSGQS